MAWGMDKKESNHGSNGDNTNLDREGEEVEKKG